MKLLKEAFVDNQFVSKNSYSLNKPIGTVFSIVGAKPASKYACGVALVHAVASVLITSHAEICIANHQNYVLYLEYSTAWLPNTRCLNGSEML